MKIGILTHHYIKNYGAFLQTYALQETLKELYPNDDIYVINYVNNLHNCINNMGWFRFNLKNDTLKTYLQKITIPLIFKNNENKYLNLTNKITTVNELNSLKFDCIVIGSDEVWNFEDKKSYDPVKFGMGISCDNIITYAPSTGKSNIELIPNEAKESLSNIKHFSARDDNSEQIVKLFAKKKCNRVVDPTLLYNFNDNTRNIIFPKENYILMYYCDNLPINLQKKIIKYAKDNHYKIYGAGDYKKWYDAYKVNLSPFEWVSMFEHAQVVFTGTFHGVVFSIKSKKDFYVYAGNEGRAKKINSLLREFCIKNRKFDENFVMENIDYEKVYTIINNKVATSKDYLIESIGEKSE